MNFMIDDKISIKGNKVLLREFTKSDINSSYIAWLNDLDIVKYSNQRFKKHDWESSQKYLDSFKASNNLFLNIQSITNNQSIGTLTAYMSPHHKTADVGILIGEKSLWGKGFGLDAWNTLSDWLLKRGDIRKLTAGTLECNYGMIKILESSGMHHEATRRKQEIVNSEAIDILYYAKFNTD